MPISDPLKPDPEGDRRSSSAGVVVPAPVALFEGRRRRRRSGLWIALAVVVVGGVGAWRWQVSRSTRGERKFKAAKVDRGSIEESVTATGALQAVETVQVGALVSGRVLELRAEENDEVKAGKVIAVIDPEPYRARVEQAKAQLAIAEAAVEKARVERGRAERERDRLTQLGNEGAAGRAEIDDAESAVELARAGEKSAQAQSQSARAALKAAGLDAARTTISSPIDGIVLSRSVEVGASVTAGFQTPTLFTIARDLEEMEVRAAIDEADVGKVKPGLTARFTVDAHADKSFEGTIADIKRSPTVTQNVVTYEAEVRVKNQARNLWPGMTATVRIVTAKKDAILRLPNAALRFKPPRDLGGKPAPKGMRRVYKLVAGKPVPVDVKVGITDEERAEIVAGDLAEGDEVVTELEGAEPPKPAGGPGGRPGGGGGAVRMRF